MRLSVLKRYLKDNFCDVAIPYMCKDVCFGVMEKTKSTYAVCTWYSCRDVFHDDFPLTNHIFVCHKNFSGNKLTKFINNVEKKLGLQRLSSYYKTYRTHASLFVLSDFWHDEMRLSLLTLLLRYSILNKKIDLDLTKNIKCKMLKDTLPALKYFFAGNTSYIGNKTGWYDQFADLKTEEVCKYFM